MNNLSFSRLVGAESFADFARVARYIVNTEVEMVPIVAKAMNEGIPNWTFILLWLKYFSFSSENVYIMELKRVLSGKYTKLLHSVLKNK